MTDAWQPITSAPKPGKVIWVAMPDHMRLAYWLDGKDHENHGTILGGWIDWILAHGQGPRGLQFAPTHWRLLPEPPEIE